MNTTCLRVAMPALLLAGLPAAAITLYVDVNSTNPVPPYTNWATAASVIQDAVDAAAAGDTVLVTNGAYLLSTEITVNTGLTLRSVNGPRETIISGNRVTRCLNLKDTASTVSGFTITNGHSTEAGGGAYCNSSTPVVSNCIFAGNLAYGTGGGMYSGTANNCIFAGNWAYGDGGGMWSGTANNCIFYGNSSSARGGGMSAITANNCAVVGNSALDSGGGIFVGTANNCTIVGNRASFGGGTRYGTANNCIIYHNTATVSGDDRESGTFRFSCSPDLSHGVNGNITNAPLLVSPYHISTNSPCRAAGSNTYSTGADLDEQPWLSPPSMGCDENSGPGTITGAITMRLVGPSLLMAGATSDYLPVSTGSLTRTQVKFWDALVVTNPVVPIGHAWATPGVYDVILTAYNDDHPLGIEFTQVVQVVSAPQATIFVSGEAGSDTNDGMSWATAKQTIQAGVDAQTMHGGRVLVTNGVYSLTKEIVVDRAILLEGLGGAASTIIDGGAMGRCLNLGGSACIVRGFTIRNGDTGINETPYGDGGGAYCVSFTPLVSECVLTGNSGYRGGGIHGGTLDQCVLAGNIATDPGGGAYYSVVNNCVISNNAGRYGGGLSWSAASNCLLVGNTSVFNGGGISGGLAVGCLMVGNAANDDGGGMNGGSIVNCLVTGNHALERGGGVSGSIANNCTIVGNTSQNSGGGMYFGVTTNCIVYYNVATVSDDNNRSGSRYYTCSPDLIHGLNGNITNAPLLVDTNAWSNLRLQSNSPCISSGNTTSAPGPTDLDGRPRIVDSLVDIGAYEYQGVGMSEFIGWLQQHGLPTDGSADHVDGDYDRASTWQEWKAWTDPTNALSVLQMLTPQPGTNGMVVPWQSVAGHSYRLERATHGTAAFTLLQSGIAGQAGTTSFTDTTATNGEAFLYRVGVPAE